MEQTSPQPAKKNIIRLIYLYLVALIGLVIFLFGGVGMVNTGLKAVLGVSNEYYMQTPRDACLGRFGSYPYMTSEKPVPPAASPAQVVEPKKVDENSDEFKNCMKDEEVRQEKQQKNDQRRDIALALAQMILGAPIWLYHWRVIQRDHKQTAA